MSRTILLTAALLGLASTAQSQVRQGLVELGGSGSFTSTEGFTVFRLAPSVGYFLTPQLEGGVQLDYVKAENSDGNGSLTVFGEYHFGYRGARTVPFVGVSLGTNLTGESDLVFGGQGGAKFFFLPGGALTGEGFLRTTGDVTTVGAAAGVAIYF